MTYMVSAAGADQRGAHGSTPRTRGATCAPQAKAAISGIIEIIDSMINGSPFLVADLSP